MKLKINIEILYWINKKLFFNLIPDLLMKIFTRQKINIFIRYMVIINKITKNILQTLFF